jgi:hypothetical protein
MVDLKQIEFLSLTCVERVPGKTFSGSLPAPDTVIVSIVVGQEKEKKKKMLIWTARGYKESRPANQTPHQLSLVRRTAMSERTRGVPQTESIVRPS